MFQCLQTIKIQMKTIRINDITASTLKWPESKLSSEWHVPAWLCLSCRRGTVRGSREATGLWGTAPWSRPGKTSAGWRRNSEPVAWTSPLRNRTKKQDEGQIHHHTQTHTHTDINTTGAIFPNTQRPLPEPEWHTAVYICFTCNEKQFNPSLYR